MLDGRWMFVGCVINTTQSTIDWRCKITGETIERKLRHLGAIRKLLDEGVAETGAKPEHGCACWFCRLLREREAMDEEDEREKQAGG